MKLSDAFAQYVKSIYGTKTISAVQLQEVRQAFFAGMVTALELSMKISEDPSEDAAAQNMEQLYQAALSHAAPIPLKRDVTEDVYVQARMRNIVQNVEAMLPPRWAVLVICAPFDEEEGRTNYAANARRDDAIKLVKDWLSHADSKDFGKHT